MDWILDASAVLAFLGLESGADRVQAALPTAMVSAVNAAEVAAKLIERGRSPAAAFDTVRLLPCQIVAVDAELGLQARGIHAVTRRLGISLGDAICLALAQRQGIPALTADRVWASLNIGVEIVLIR